MGITLPRPTRRQPLVRSWALLGLVLAFTFGVVACSASPTTGTSPDQRGSRAQGRLVDIDGRHLYLECRGTGTPTVVFVAGLGDSGETAWRAVWDQTAQSTRACIYDRAGLRRSDPGPTATTYQGAADDLNALLQSARTPNPYVLVGHSLGGLLARRYTHDHPAEVAGVVLVDATPVGWFPTLQRLLPPELLVPLARNPEGFDLRHGLASLAPLDAPGVLDDRPLAVMWTPTRLPSGLPAAAQRTLAGTWEAEQIRLRGLSTRSRLERVAGPTTISNVIGPSSWWQGSTTSCSKCRSWAEGPRRSDHQCRTDELDWPATRTPWSRSGTGRW